MPSAESASCTDTASSPPSPASCRARPPARCGRRGAEPWPSTAVATRGSAAARPARRGGGRGLTARHAGTAAVRADTMTRCASSSPPTASPAPSRPARPPRRSPKAGVARRRTTGWPCCRCPTAAPASSTSSPAPSAAQSVAVTVSDPLGRHVPAALLVVEHGGHRTVYVESAQACGLHLLAAGGARPHPDQLVRRGAAARGGAGRGRRAASSWVLGGSGTNDGGAGMLAALGVGTARPLGAGRRSAGRPRRRRAARAGRGPRAVPRGRAGRRDRRGPDPARLPRRQRVSRRRNGRHARAGPAAGGRPRAADRGRPAHAAAGRRTCSPAPPGGSTASRGPAPPVGWATACCCSAATSRSGVDAVLRGRRFRRPARRRRPGGHRRGVLDWQSLRGKVVAGVAAGRAGRRRARRRARRSGPVGRRETMALGIVRRPTRWPSAPTGSPLFRPTRPAPWRRARPGSPAPGPRAVTARRTLDGVGNTSRRPWVGTVDRTPLRRAISS